MFEWYTELWDTEWVVWWYGPRADGGGYVEPACVRVNMGGSIGVMEFPFKLPEREGSTLAKPQEVRRLRAVGWRVRNNNGTHDCGWNLAKDEATARAVSAAWIERHIAERRSSEVLRSAVTDVRIRTE